MEQNIPFFFYGTAWKEERTAPLTFDALQAGFRAIDTANQRKHYHEEGVGLGIERFLTSGLCRREDLFLQTKFTFASGQDHRKPYKNEDSIAQQVASSFKSSLEHLKTHYIDSLVLHGPYGYSNIGKEDLEAWSAMEHLVKEKKVRFLGISNVSLTQLSTLCEKVRIQPRLVQNRCYAHSGWDKQIRDFCRQKNISYQGFSLLTANSSELASPIVTEIAKKYQKTIPQIVFKFCQQIGMVCLTGTSNKEQMLQDLDINDFNLSYHEISQIENL